VALVQDDLTVSASVHHNAQHLAVADDGTAGDEVWQRQVEVFFLARGFVND